MEIFILSLICIGAFLGARGLVCAIASVCAEKCDVLSAHSWLDYVLAFIVGFLKGVLFIRGRQ